MIDLEALDRAFRPALERIIAQCEALLLSPLAHPRHREHIEIILHDCMKMLSLFNDPRAYQRYLADKYKEPRDLDRPTVSHELRSPVGRVMSFTSLLLDCPDIYDYVPLTEDQHARVDQIADLARSLLSHEIFRRAR